MKTIVVGGGLAGSEAALQLAHSGIEVILYEMRPTTMTPAHRSNLLGEIICSNSFKSVEIGNAHGLLKRELELLGSFLLNAAEKSRIPAGKALAVDRNKFAKIVTDEIERNPKINLRRKEIINIPTETAILATGPLTSSLLAKDLEKLMNCEGLYFYDAISPIVTGDSINSKTTFRGSRYGVDDSYVNCPMDKTIYDKFVDHLLKAPVYPLHHFETPSYFEGCLPIEELARRGRDTLRFGPMKPVGFTESHHAILQLRPEDEDGAMFSLVGCQTRILIPEQRKIFRLVPGLEDVRFLRYGAVHRNSFINAPKHIYSTLQLKEKPDLFIAGQLTGTEGYVEAIATGLLAGINMARLLHNKEPIIPPRETMLGGLINYITAPNDNFQPMNANFGLLPGRGKKDKVDRAIRSMELWQEEVSNI